MCILYDAADSSKWGSMSYQLTWNWRPRGANCPEAHPLNIVPYVEGFEIKAHLIARQPQRALDLMRTSWGWYLNNPNGTGSTFIEGYTEDGSFNYANNGYDNAGSYPSHAHGWSAGPADALTTYVVGIQLNNLSGSSWTIAPQFGDLTSAEGGLTTPRGKFQAGWTKNDSGYVLKFTTPEDTTGTIILPNDGCKSSITLDVTPWAPNCDSSSPTRTFSVPAGYHALTVKS